MKWQQLEDHVRLIASCKWATLASAEHINGVDIDCVVKVAPGRWILAEISKSSTLEKLRDDLAKFASVRQYLFQQNIFPECFFICETEPPPSLIVTGRGAMVTVLSASAFDRMFLDYHSYRHLRLQHKFGSAVDPESGQSDPRMYVPVRYVCVAQGRNYAIGDLAEAIRNGRKVVLLGNYGTGKSRCVRELFGTLSQRPDLGAPYPLAIDLRDQWGMKRAREVIARHCDDLGLGQLSDPVMRVLDQGLVCLLLDGFDEIGSQTWSDNSARLTQIRAQSLSGVRDLLSRHRGGVIITGREHYFNSNDEMFQCLGLEPANVLLLRCADEFTELEMRSYLEKGDRVVDLPTWVPRRPLVCQLVAKMEVGEIAALHESQTGEAAFWQVFVTALCERERRIHAALDPVTIRRLLRRLARMSRDKPGDVGPITVEEMSKAFFAVTGMHPVDESAVMLQRLSSLGRVASETSDRCFVDHYILDGLRAEDLTTAEEHEIPQLANERWRNPLRRLGVTLLSADIITAAHATHYARLLKTSSVRQNAVLAGDIVAGMLVAGEGEVSFNGISVRDAHVACLDFGGRLVKGLAIANSVIDLLDITDCRVEDVEISESIIQQVLGVSAAGGMPGWIKGCDVETYESVSTVARIRRAELTDEQRIFLTIVKKLFFQPGAGRKEEALLRGLGESAKKKSAERILKRLRADKVVNRIPGNQGWVFVPVREHTSRMGRIMMELTLSEDPLWTGLRK